MPWTLPADRLCGPARRVSSRAWSSAPIRPDLRRRAERIAAYLSGLVRRDKLFVFHQLTKQIVDAEQVLRPHPCVAMVKSVDGIGTAGAKEATYRQLSGKLPREYTPASSPSTKKTPATAP